MDFFLCLNHNVISPETIKEHHPDAAESDHKLSVVCKDEDFFFSEEKQKIGEWLINNYYGMC